MEIALFVILGIIGVAFVLAIAATNYGNGEEVEPVLWSIDEDGKPVFKSPEDVDGFEKRMALMVYDKYGLNPYLEEDWKEIKKKWREEQKIKNV